MTVLDFTLPAELEAHEPPEARGVQRDDVRLLVGKATTGSVSNQRFADLPELLQPGDTLVVNTSGTLAAAVPVAVSDLTVHFSTELPDATWLVELRQSAGKATATYAGGAPGDRYALLGGAIVTLRRPYSHNRLWIAEIDTAGFESVPTFLQVFGRPIRYSYVQRSWPIDYYQTVFANRPGSAEMPSASRPFTDRIVTQLVSAGVQFAPVLLHTGVASPEAHERPYPERFAVSTTTARQVNRAREDGSRVIAIGTTAVRALESAVDREGRVTASSGWTDLIVTPERGVRVVNGLLTGLHEPRASHLDMLAAIAPQRLLDRCYDEAIKEGYLWHEFGDVNLLLP
jgi:S-adenosylmethionine:tRNA ribosyltransferase-isomerase